jgi:hypothetical protein
VVNLEKKCIRYAGLGFRSVSAGIGDSVEALILGLVLKSLGVPNNSDCI